MSVIGTDIGGTHMRTALIDERGRIIQQRKTKTDIKLGAESAGARLTAECQALMEQANRVQDPVQAIGLGIAGKIDSRRGTVLFSPNLPAMKDYPLAAVLQKALGLPIVLENDANAFGIGEQWMGSGGDIRNWVGLTLGTGVGGCLILDDRLWTGDHLGYVAEIGHMIIDPHGPCCVCGLQGCLEAHASARALLEGVSAAASRGELAEGPLRDTWQAGTLDALTVYSCAQQGDRLAGILFKRLGWALGLALANLFGVLGIRHAIIGGGVSAAWDQFAPALRDSLNHHSCMLESSRMVVRPSMLGDDAALLGAAKLALDGGGRKARG